MRSKYVNISADFLSKEKPVQDPIAIGCNATKGTWQQFNWHQYPFAFFEGLINS